MRTDSAGVNLVLNGPTDRLLEWTFEPVLDLGSSGDGSTAFFRVFRTSIGVDSLGNLYVLDAGNFRVSVFDRAGRHLRSFGSEGEGPGEFGFPSDMSVSPSGEVAVYDFARRGLVLFDADGTYTGAVPLPGVLQRQFVLVDDRSITAAVSQRTDVPNSTEYRLLTLGTDTTEIARVRQISDPPPRQFSCMSLARPPLFGPRIVWAASGHRIALSEDATFAIRIFDQERLAAIWIRDLPVIESTPELAAWEVADGDSLRFRGPVAARGRNCAVPAEEAATQFGYAAVAPIITNLAVAADGGIWVRRRTIVPGESRIDLFDATGAYVGTLPGQSPFPVLFRGPDEIVTVEKDEFDIPHVVVYRVNRDPAES